MSLQTVESGAPEPEAGQAAAPLRERVAARWYDLRDRLLASQRFHRFAAAFPLFRPFARAKARALFDICAGFTYTQTLLAATRLKMFDILADGPQHIDQISARMGLSADAGRRLLDAAASLDLAKRLAHGRYRLGGLGAAFRGTPGLAEMVEHHAILYRDLEDPAALLQAERPETRLGAFWPYATEAAPSSAADTPKDAVQAAATYSALMTATQPLVADEVLAAYDFRRHRRLLDLGGGEGAFLRQAAARAPDLELTLMDLPPVAAAARERLDEAGLRDRARVIPGDFLTDLFHEPLAATADLVTLIRILFDHPDARAVDILRAARRAVSPGGVVLIAEPMAGTPGAEAIGDAYYGFYLLAMGGGRPRRSEDLAALARAAGFRSVRALPMRRPILTRVLAASP